MRYYTLAVFLLTSCASATDGGGAGFVCPDGWTCSQDAADASDAQPDVIGTEDDCGVWYKNASGVPECHVVGESCDIQGLCAKIGRCWWILTTLVPPTWTCGSLTDADCQATELCQTEARCTLGSSGVCTTEYNAKQWCRNLTGEDNLPVDGKCPE